MTSITNYQTDEPITNIENFTLTAGQDRTIKGRIFYASNPSSVVIVAPAMGITQEYYKKFAQFLASQNYQVITFDYFGTGDSLSSHIKDCDTDVRQWGELDCEALIHYTKKAFPNLTLQWIGHSVGGQLLGMIPSANHLDNAITMACGSGYWIHNSPQTRRIVWLLWYVIAPISTKLYGYFPGSKLNMVGDLAPKVMKQWRSWCLNKEYSVGVEGPEIRQRYAALTTPITSISFSDDHMISERNTHSLHSFFKQSDVKHVRVNPKEVGETFIGHLGWFREKFKDSVWAGQVLPNLK